MVAAVAHEVTATLARTVTVRVAMRAVEDEEAVEDEADEVVDEVAEVGTKELLIEAIEVALLPMVLSMAGREAVLEVALLENRESQRQKRQSAQRRRRGKRPKRFD